METIVGPAVRSRRRLGMLAVLGALSSFGPLSMDMYLPSTPTIAANLHASQSLVQLTLSGCLAGLAVGQLVAGPVSDGLGRKRPLLAGLAAFTVLSVACAAAPDIGALIAFRFLQGMAGAGGVVLSLAIVRDLYTGTELARVLGSLMLVFGLAPVLAPVIGGQILRFTSWRGVFGVLAAIGLVLFLLAWFLPETLSPERRTPSRPHQLIADSRTLVRDRQYVGYTLAIACGNAALITYISALPFIVEDAYHESPQLFSVFFMINSIGLVAMAQLGARLVKRVPVAKVVLGSLIVMAAGCAGFLLAALTGHPPLAVLLVPLFFFIAFFGSMRPNATAIALANQGAIRHGVGLGGRAAVPARRLPVPAGRPWRGRRRDRGGHHAHRALRGRPALRAAGPGQPPRCPAARPRLLTRSRAVAGDPARNRSTGFPDGKPKEISHFRTCLVSTTHRGNNL